MHHASTVSRTMVLSLTALALFVSSAVVPVRAQLNLYEQTLNVVSFGGDWTRGQMLAMIRPWEAESGKFVTMHDYGGGLSEIRSQVSSANVKWDVIDMEYSDLISACGEGLLEPVDTSVMMDGSDGTPLSDDLPNDAMHECGYPTIVWSTVYAYDTNAFEGNQPSTIGDFFDTVNFPGKRAMRRDPRVLLEWSLIAAGVAPEDVYTTLSTPEGVELAFQTADLLKPNLVWWTSGAQPVSMLSEGTVTMAGAWGGRLYRPIAEQGLPIDIVWDGQMWEVEYYAIPKGSPRLASAKEFIRFATSTEALANVSKHISYGPIRKSSESLIDENARPFLPTSNMGNSLRVDSIWWAENFDTLKARFEEWLRPPSLDETERQVRF